MKPIINSGIKLFLLFTFIFNLNSCSDDAPTRAAPEISFVSYQVPGCNPASSLKKDSFIDSCFQYSFTDTLKVEFCVPGNCCPDSDRFATNYSIYSDTIFVTVTDTAAHLCHCICDYIIHLEITGLPNDEYLFYCDCQDLEYIETVIRSNRF